MPGVPSASWLSVQSFTSSQYLIGICNILQPHVATFEGAGHVLLAEVTLDIVPGHCKLRSVTRLADTACNERHSGTCSTPHGSSLSLQGRASAAAPAPAAARAPAAVPAAQ